MSNIDFLKNAKSKKIVVIGSSNTDLVIKSNHFPTPGSTVKGFVVLFICCKYLL
jgi:hypothetical protein